MQKLKCYVAGFGAVEYQGESSQFLKSIHVNIIKDDTCKQAYSSYEEKMEFCAGEKLRIRCAANTRVTIVFSRPFEGWSGRMPR